MIHPPQHIEARLDLIQGILESHYDSDEGHAMVSRISDLCVYMAESGKLLGDAKYHYQAKLESELMKLIKDLLPEYASANLQNSFVKSLCKDEMRLVNMADRINATCTHQIDALRSQLSYLKSLAFP